MAVSASPNLGTSPGRRSRRPAPDGGRTGPSVGLVSTYPPTKCGLATFTASLARALASSRRPATVGVVRCLDARSRADSPPEVVAEWVQGSPVSLGAAVRALDPFSSVVVQHEFGVFGGEDGADVLHLVRRLSAPVIVVLHTVIATPTARQRAIVEELGSLAGGLVAQSAVARERLLAAHDIDPGRVSVIPHGAPARPGPAPRRPGLARGPAILTWGLIGPGKGIEFAIEALALLRDLDPAPTYTVLGETHPNVVRDAGEGYRELLEARARELGVERLVRFDARYRDAAAIQAELRAADVVLLPYRSREQVVSGVLVEAIAAGKPVVATAFPHAVELLGAGSGIVVPHEDPEAIAGALRLLLTDAGASARAAAVARRQAASLSWEQVGLSYRRLAGEIGRAAVPAG